MPATTNGRTRPTNPRIFPEGEPGGDTQKGTKTRGVPKSPKPPKLSPKQRAKEARREEIVAYIAGVVCTIGLALSGIDSALALVQFYKYPPIRAAMLACVIDGSMVIAEISALVSSSRKVRLWANIYIIGAGALSVYLNSREFASHGSDMMSYVIGGAIPILVLVSSRYAGHLYLSSKS